LIWESPTVDDSPTARTDVHTGARTYIVGSRQVRPNLPQTTCPFCPGGLEAPDDYDVRWFANRWPAMAGDRCEVILYTADHDATFWELGQARARDIVDLWAERSAVLGARDDVAYVLVFENRGASVGATIAHPHGQIYAFDEVPEQPARELERGDLLSDPGDRLVAEHGSWRAVVPEAPIFPYAVTLASREPVPDLPSLPSEGRDDLAAYEPFGTAIVVPIGPEGGSGQLPGQEELASREMVATVKGRDLMVDRYAEIFGLTTPISP